MGGLKPGHLIEAALWLTLAAVLYVYSFEFDKEIEIYRYGASAWPRAILLLLVIAALGQLLTHWKKGGGAADLKAGMIGQAAADGASAPAASHNNLKWYAWTFGLLAIPFVYMNLPDWAAALMGWDKPGLHAAKLVCAAALLSGYALAIRGNPLGGMLALPILFSALLQDFGFYAAAPVFMLGVMHLMGERRCKHLLAIMTGLCALLLLLFVSLLYVGLPIGNITPFYEFGAAVVNLLQ